MEIRVDAAAAMRDLQAKPVQVRRATARWLREGSNHTAGIMRRVIASRVGARRISQTATGQTAGSVRATVSGDAAVIAPQPRQTKWGTFDPVFLDQDTRAHVIQARFAQALAFPRSGSRAGTRRGQRVSVFRFGGRTAVTDLVYATRVHHPGTKGIRFIAETHRQVDGYLHDLYRRLLAAETGRA